MPAPSNRRRCQVISAIIGHSDAGDWGVSKEVRKHVLVRDGDGRALKLVVEEWVAVSRRELAAQKPRQSGRVLPFKYVGTKAC
jgi:hypothetical protein